MKEKVLLFPHKNQKLSPLTLSMKIGYISLNKTDNSVPFLPDARIFFVYIFWVWQLIFSSTNGVEVHVFTYEFVEENKISYPTCYEEVMDTLLAIVAFSFA